MRFHSKYRGRNIYTDGSTFQAYVAGGYARSGALDGIKTAIKNALNQRNK